MGGTDVVFETFKVKIPYFFFYYSFGTVGLLGTIVENDEKIFNKVVGGMKNI